MRQGFALIPRHWVVRLGSALFVALAALGLAIVHVAVAEDRDVDFHNLYCFSHEVQTSAGALSPVPDWVFPYDAIANNAWWQGNFFYAGAYGYVSGVGDVNGDIYDDIVVGFEWLRARPGVAGAGGANFAFQGSAMGPTGPEWEYILPQTDLWSPLQGVGDLNGDGYADVALYNYAWQAPDSTAYNAEVLIFAGSADGLADAPTWRLQGQGEERDYGYHFIGNGDVNGDGYADLFVGYAVEVGYREYWRYIAGYAGSPTGPVLTWMFSDETDDSWAGPFVDYLGDINNDGYDELLVHVHAGFAQSLYYGSLYGPSVAVDVPEGYYDPVGDVNGDGYDDILILNHDFPGFYLLYLGTTDGLSDEPAWEIEHSGNFGFGRSRPLGDVNDDGFADFLIATQACWEMRVFLGSADPASISPAWSLISTWEPNPEQYMPWLNLCIEPPTGVTGDVNGDGYDDLAVSLSCFGDEFFGLVVDQYVFFGGYDPPPATTTTTTSTIPTSTTTTITVPHDDDADDDANDDDIENDGDDSGADDDVADDDEAGRCCS